MAELKLFNTLSRKKETFKSIRKDSVSLYTCGPTVYNFAHIGNLRTYIFEDILRRTLAYNGYSIKHVMNITDVGHLSGDQDFAEDKMEKTGKTTKEILAMAKKYTEVFLRDLESLNILRADTIAPATEHIAEQIALIEKLFEQGYAYETELAIYFDVSKFLDYTKLSKQKLNEKKTAARAEVVIDKEKRNPGDFALWFKLAGRYKTHVLRWPSPWGEGFPGWHIECSAIASKLLGQPFDIHTGGVDHIFPHHTNEIAQSEGAMGKPLANYWLHGEFLLIEEGRMGKSERNFFTLADVIEKGFDPLAYRYLVLGAHYRSKLNFTWKSLEAAQSGFSKVHTRFIEILAETGSEEVPDISADSLTPAVRRFRDAFLGALNDDLNTPKALAVFHEVLEPGVLPPGEQAGLIWDLNKALGLFKGKPEPVEIPSEVQKLVEMREKCRASKQFVQADDLRKQINDLGYEVKDTEAGPKVWPRHPN